MGPPKKNPFIHFVESRRKEEQQATGVKYSLPDAIQRFGAEWGNLSGEMRAPFYAMAKKPIPYKVQESLGVAELSKETRTHSSDDAPVEKTDEQRSTAAIKEVIPEEFTDKAREENYWLGSRTCLGFTMEEIVKENMTRAQGIERQRFQISRLCDEKFGDVVKHRFVLVNVSLYAEGGAGNMIIPAEIGIAVFSIEEGLVDNFCTFIDPGRAPLGYAAEFRSNAKKLGLPLPPFDSECSQLEKIWKQIENFLDRYKTHNTDTTYLFCQKREMDNVNGAMDWLGAKTGNIVRWDSYPYPTLLYELSKVSRIYYIDWLQRQRKIAIAINDRTSLVSFTDSPSLLSPYGSEMSYQTSNIIRDFSGSSDDDDASTLSHVSITSCSEFDERILRSYSSLEEIDTSNPPSVIKNGPERARRIPKTEAHRMNQGLECYIRNIEERVHHDDELADSQQRQQSDSWNLGASRQSQTVSEASSSEQYRDQELFVTESQAEEFLDSTDLAFMRELACPHHMMNCWVVDRCPLNVSNRLVFNTLDILLGFFHIAPKMGQHCPNLDLKQERYKRRMQVMYYSHCTYEGLDGFKDSTFPQAKPVPSPSSSSVSSEIQRHNLPKNFARKLLGEDEKAQHLVGEVNEEVKSNASCINSTMSSGGNELLKSNK